LAQLDRAKIAEMQKQASSEGWTFEVGENDATKYSLDQLCGLKEPEGWRSRANFNEMTATSSSAVLPSAFDWRTYNGCTPIRNQGGCGSCWAFATVGALECAIKIREGSSVDLSEQWLLSCNQAGWSCGGGWYAHSYHGLLADGCNGTGAVLESDFSYDAWETPCACPYPHHYVIDSWAYIGGNNSVTGVEAMKRAILEYGPISVSVYASDYFQAYRNGIFSYSTNGTINHSVVLVGWDDSQGSNGIWIMRNSWGSGWGEGGYMRIAYSCCQIGYAACYVDYRPVRITVQNNFGAAPLTVDFQSEVIGSTATGYTWDFGDGGISHDANPAYTYNTPGCYTVKLTVITPDGNLYKLSPNLVSAHADTLRGFATQVDSSGSVRMDVSVRNSLPLDRITIPFSWDGPFQLSYDSSSLTGSRAAYFGEVTTVSIDIANDRAAIMLQRGTQRPLAAGNGIVASLWFTVASGMAGVNPVSFVSYGQYSPLYESGTNAYEPALQAGYFFRGVSIGCCAGKVGDVNQSGADVPTISDVSALVDHLFLTRRPLGCIEEADVNQSGGAMPSERDLTIGDIQRLVDHLFISKQPLLNCF
jgi:C1A family cysteine protease